MARSTDPSARPRADRFLGSPVHRPSTTRPLLALTAAATLLLAGACGSETSGSASSPAAPATSSAAMTSEMTSAPNSEASTGMSSSEMSSEDSTSSSDESTSSSEESSSSSEESTSSSAESSSSAATSAGSSEKPTAPGTVLKLGQAAVVEYQTGKKGDSYYQKGTMKVAVTKVVKADPKIFDKLDNKADFKGYTPYFIFSESEILTYEGKADGNPPTQIVVYGIQANGQEVGKAIGLASLEGCDDTYFPEPKPGAKGTKCTVALSKSGAVVGAVYEGDTDLYSDSSQNPFTKKPLIWKN